MHPNSEGKAIVEDRPSEPERAKELQNLYNVSINSQFQDIFTSQEGILTGAIKQKADKQVSHVNEVISINDYSQTTNTASQTLEQNQETIDNCSQGMLETDCTNTSKSDQLKYVCQLESRFDLRELRSITQLSHEIRSSRILNENLSLTEENSRLKEKNQQPIMLDIRLKYSTKGN